MKRFILILLALACLLAGCGREDKKAEKREEREENVSIAGKYVYHSAYSYTYDENGNPVDEKYFYDLSFFGDSEPAPDPYNPTEPTEKRTLENMWFIFNEDGTGSFVQVINGEEEAQELDLNDGRTFLTAGDEAIQSSFDGDRLIITLIDTEEVYLEMRFDRE